MLIGVERGLIQDSTHDLSNLYVIVPPFCSKGARYGP